MNRRGYILACLLVLTIFPVAAFAQAAPAKVDSSVYKACFSSGAAKAEEVIGACSAILESNPRVAEAYYNRGVARMQLNQLEGALADFNKAIEINPQDPDAWNNRGLIYNRQGKPGAAISDFSKAIELDDLYGKAYCNRGLVYLKLGRTADAEEDLKTAARLGVKEAEDYLKSKGIAYVLPHRFEIALSYSQFDYKEDVQPPLKSTEMGWIPQVRLGYSYVADDQFYFRAFGELSVGKDDTDYDGSTMSGVPLKGTTQNDFARLEMDFGYTFKGSLPVSITPYTGLGYRYWKRDIGYNETYSWWYIPVGAKLLYPVAPNWTIGLNASVNFMFEGHMTASFKSDQLQNATFTLGDRPGALVELPITWRPFLQWAFTVTPWYEYSEIGKSDAVPVYYYNGALYGIFYEPTSRTNQYGIRISTEYLF
jgi:tetratricopeptide (TPR) repeat protein